ncbi:hypothetical protein IF2G_01493 [Cordyceps javanica]|nr:hypothetical protein IF2G_01493 [Cordyceps javanica]
MQTTVIARWVGSVTRLQAFLAWACVAQEEQLRMKQGKMKKKEQRQGHFVFPMPQVEGGWPARCKTLLHDTLRHRERCLGGGIAGRFFFSPTGNHSAVGH